MKGLLLKEIFTLKSYVKSIAIFLGIFTVIGLASDIYRNMLPMFVLLYASMSAITTFSYDDLAKWNKFLYTMPVTRKMVVKSKYVLFFILLGIGSILAFLLGIGVEWIRVQTVNIGQIASTILGAAIGLILVACFQYPFIYKYGIEKGRIFVFIIAAIFAFAIGAAAIVGLPILTDGASESVLSVILKFGWIIVPVILFLLIYFSYRMSCKICEKKEY